jgi:hypothetical protein
MKIAQLFFACLCLLMASQNLSAQDLETTIPRPPIEEDENGSYYGENNDSDSQAEEKNEELYNLIGNWPRRRIQEIRIDIREMEPVAPKDRSLELAGNAPNSDWTQFYPAPKVYAWAAPNIRYQPLYLEDVALERYGQTAGLHLQPWKSSLHFFGSAALGPFKMLHDPPCSCDYPLGFCRPGNCIQTVKQYQLRGHK